MKMVSSLSALHTLANIASPSCAFLIVETASFSLGSLNIVPINCTVAPGDHLTCFGSTNADFTYFEMLPDIPVSVTPLAWDSGHLSAWNLIALFRHGRVSGKV
jgi:hypothetical protein